MSKSNATAAAATTVKPVFTGSVIDLCAKYNLNGKPLKSAYVSMLLNYGVGIVKVGVTDRPEGTKGKPSNILEVTNTDATRWTRKRPAKTAEVAATA